MPGEKAAKGLRPFAPQPFGRYTLLAPLASGGMGEVFLARLDGAEGFAKQVVIKKILPALAHDQDFIDRFVTEAKVLVKLHHGSVAQVLDMGQHEGDYYIALEFVDGKDLRKVAARCKERGHTVPLGLTLFVAMRVLDALAYAHRKKGDDEQDLNLVHRDVSPQNVLISYEGEVKVIDFGLAKSSLSLGRTSPNVVLGKFFYMSPEQAKHQKVDRRSDLYATGICLYELIAGKNPFEGVAQGELMAAVANPTIEPLGMAMPGVPEAVDKVVMRALAPDPKDRFTSAEEMRARVMAAMLELDPGAGPESLAHFMRAVFASEYAHERKVFAALREGGPSAGSEARTGLMPALRLAKEEDEAPINAGPAGVTQVAPLKVANPASMDTQVGVVETRPTTAEMEPYLPPARTTDTTDLSSEVEGRRTTDPARTALEIPRIPAEVEQGELHPATRLGPPPGASPGDPQEFKLPGTLPEPNSQLESDLVAPTLEPDLVAPTQEPDLVAKKQEPSLPILQAAMVEEPEPAPPPVLASTPTPARPAPALKPTAAVPRAAPPRLEPGSPKVLVADDLHKDVLPPGERIETLSTRPLMSSARDGRVRGPSGDRERPLSGTARRPARPAELPAQRPPSGTEPVVRSGGMDSNTRRSLFIGLGIGAGLVVLAVAALVAWRLLH